MNIWWCCQTRCWESEREAGVVCCAESDSPYRRWVEDIRRGDLIVHYLSTPVMGIVAVSRARTDGRWLGRGINLRKYGVRNCVCEYGPGWLAEVEYYDFHAPIPITAVAGDLTDLTGTHWPVLKSGRVRQGYLMPFSVEGLDVLFGASQATWPEWAVREMKKRSRVLDRRTCVWIARTLKAHDRAGGFRIQRIHEKTRLENYHRWADGRELFSLDTITNPDGATLDLLVIDWGEETYKLVVYPPDRSIPIAEIRNVERPTPELTLTWRYVPSKRDGLNPVRVERFVESWSGRDVELHLSDTEVSVAGFLKTLFTLVETRRQADRLSVAGPEPVQSEDAIPGRVIRSVQDRQGQQEFRRELLEAYGGRCAISGTDVEEALQAAHIRWYSESSFSDVSNGLLLRADLHNLFDYRLIWINPESWTVEIAPTLKRSTYAEIDGVKLRLPADHSKWPKIELIREHANHAKRGR